MGTYYPPHNYGPQHAAAIGDTGAAEPRREISQKQLDANRRNALRSTGPRTEEGKARSRCNAARHTLTGQIDVLTEEDRTARNAFCDAIAADLKPEGALERQIALSVALDHWRLNRIRSMEDNIFALRHYTPAADIDVDHPELHAALTSARVFLESASEFQLLTLYEQRISRNVSKSMAQLEAMQTRRKAERTTALEEAARIAAVDEHEGRADNDGERELAEDTCEQPAAAANGFVFSAAEIAACRRRAVRLQAAAFYEKHHWDPEIEFPHAA